MLQYTCYMTDGSGAYHMKYNVPNADRLGEESGRVRLHVNSGEREDRRDTQDVFLLFAYKGNFQIFPPGGKQKSYLCSRRLYFFQYLSKNTVATLDKYVRLA